MHKTKKGNWESRVLITIEDVYGDFGELTEEEHKESVLERVAEKHGSNAKVKFIKTGMY